MISQLKKGVKYYFTYDNEQFCIISLKCEGTDFFFWQVLILKINDSNYVVKERYSNERNFLKNLMDFLYESKQSP